LQPGLPADVRATPVDAITAAVQAQGFAQVTGLLEEADLRSVEIVLDDLLLTRDPVLPRRRRELASAMAPDRLLTPEYERPSLTVRRLRDSAVYTKCQELASKLLGRRAHYLFDHAIYKMPRSGTDVPWHQDQSYLGSSVRIRSLHFWIPLQDVGLDAGCLRFVPGSHKRALPHRRAYEQNPHVLSVACEAVNGSIQVPLRRGDISIHTSLTLHSSGPNDTDAIRKAWIIHYGDRPRWYKHLMKLRGFVSGGESVSVPSRG
jgi:hypothetical protein